MSKNDKNETSKELLSFEEKIENSKKLLDELMNPQITLSQSVEVFKKGVNELKNAQEMLENAKLEYEELNKPN